MTILEGMVDIWRFHFINMQTQKGALAMQRKILWTQSWKFKSEKQQYMPK